MGLTVSRKTANNLIVRRKNIKILTVGVINVNRKKKKQSSHFHLPSLVRTVMLLCEFVSCPRMILKQACFTTMGINF